MAPKLVGYLLLKDSPGFINIIMCVFQETKITKIGKLIPLIVYQSCLLSMMLFSTALLKYLLEIKSQQKKMLIDTLKETV